MFHIFFRDGVSNAVTMTDENYRTMIEDFLLLQNGTVEILKQAFPDFFFRFFEVTSLYEQVIVLGHPKEIIRKVEEIAY